MNNVLFDRRHLREYMLYGSLAGLVYIIPMWYFLHRASYHSSAFLFVGSMLFMFVIMIYSIKLTRRKPDYKSSWMMLVAGHMAVLIGIVLSVLAALILCAIYIPGFFGGRSPETFLENAPVGYNDNNAGAIGLVFITATVANFGAAAFISTLISYVVKLNQTKDKTPSLFEKPAPPQAKDPAF